MGYHKRLGEIALHVLLQRIGTNLPHFDRTRRENFFIEEITSFFTTYEHIQHWICRQKIPHFGRTLALHAYGPAWYTENTAALPPTSCFLWMCFVYVVCLSRRNYFDIGDKNVNAHLQAREIEISEEEFIEFWSEVSSHVWKSRKKLQAKAKKVA